MTNITFKAKVKNSIHGNGMIQCQELKSIIGKNITVTIIPDEDVEITETKKE